MPVSTSTTTTIVTSNSNNTSKCIVISSPLVVLDPTTRALAFEDLLKAPTELLGRGKYRSLYKVIYDDGATSPAVKRMKDPSIPAKMFRSRMELIDRARHPNVHPVVAFYCSKQEKLVVYEFQKNGSLFKVLHDQINDHLKKLKESEGESSYKSLTDNVLAMVTGNKKGQGRLRGRCSLILSTKYKSSSYARAKLSKMDERQHAKYEELFVVSVLSMI